MIMRRIYILFQQRSREVNAPDNEPLNKRLERLRRAQGLTAKAMAQLVGLPESTYREWEYGHGLKPVLMIWATYAN